MDLIYHLLAQRLLSEKTEITFPQLDGSIKQLMESECYQILEDIKKVLEDDSNSDETCFLRIEEIVRVFEAHGSSCGNRHDFG